jgi:hypothetical protein
MFLREDGVEHFRGRRCYVEKLWGYLKSYDSGRQDLHEGECISRDEEVEVIMLAGLAMVVGSKCRRSRFK